MMSFLETNQSLNSEPWIETKSRSHFCTTTNSILPLLGFLFQYKNAIERRFQQFLSHAACNLITHSPPVLRWLVSDGGMNWMHLPAAHPSQVMTLKRGSCESFSLQMHFLSKRVSFFSRLFAGVYSLCSLPLQTQFSKENEEDDRYFHLPKSLKLPTLVHWKEIVEVFLYKSIKVQYKVHCQTDHMEGSIGFSLYSNDFRSTITKILHVHIDPYGYGSYTVRCQEVFPSTSPNWTSPSI